MISINRNKIHINRGILSVLAVLILVPCAWAREVKITLFQLNDVYEMMPVSGGKRGGLARVATLLKNLKAENPNTFSILAGDLFSPSALGTARVNGKPWAGSQMVKVFNHMSWDYFTFGNHEFDLKKEELKSRLLEASFTTFSCNVFERSTGERFPGTRRSVVREVDGVRIGFVGVTMKKLSAEYAWISDSIAAAKVEVERLKAIDKVDIVIAVTHQPREDDVRLVESVPAIDLVIGGHEHENMKVHVGEDQALITKADSNAKSGYIHRLAFDTDTGVAHIESNLQLITDEIADDETTDVLIQNLKNQAFDVFRKSGIDPDEELGTLRVDLDGLESNVRNRSTELTQLIADGYLAAFPDAALSLFNAGSIRFDDVLFKGSTLTAYDIFRILPYGDTITRVEMQGDLLIRTLNVGKRNFGKGSFLHTANVTSNGGDWQVGGELIDENEFYPVVLTSYLIDQGDYNLEFLTQPSPKLRIHDDVKPVDTRKATVEELKRVLHTP